MHYQKPPKTTHLAPSDSYPLNVQPLRYGDLPFESPPIHLLNPHRD